MGHTYTRLLVHIVFSTKARHPIITDDIAPRLHAYLGGIIREQGGTALRIGGVRDHVHILAAIPTSVCVADLLRTVKSNSSGWVHDTFPALAAFAWQSGYSAFSVSPEDSERVEAYIAMQAEHHRKVSYQDEVRELLRACGIELDEKYAWD
jgi:putative transposase